MNRNLRNLIVAASLFTRPLVAATILNETYTASEIYSMATFPSRPPSLTIGKTRLEFPVGAADNQVLLVLPLLPANSLSVLEPAIVTLTLDTVLITASNDLAVGLSDGESFVSVMRSDAFITESYWVEAAFSTPTIPSTEFTSSATLGTGAEVFTMTFTLGTSTTVTATIGSGSDTRVFTRVINREKPLSLVFMAYEADLHQQYGIESATVRIDQVPEPTGTFLLLAGISGLTFRRNRIMT
jgi:hypothetical protein